MMFVFVCCDDVCVCLLQTIFSRRMRGRVRGGGNPVGGASVGFSSHSHAKFVNQLMRESRFRVREREKGRLEGR